MLSGPLAGKVVIVTGGASGIGAATVHRLAAGGAAVVVADLDEEGARAVAEEVTAGGADAMAVRCDLGEAEQVTDLVAQTVARYGGVDGIDHNAAWTSYRGDTDALGVDLDVWEKVLRVNARGGLLLSRAVVPHLLQRGGGSIVMISSGAGTIGEDTRVAYGMSKAALNQLTRHLANRYGRAGIRANAVAPGFVLTETAKRAMSDEQLDQLRAANPTGRLGRPLDIANVVAFLLSDESAYINGQTIHVDGGMLVAGRLSNR